MPTENRSSNTDPRDVFIRLNPLGLGEAELRKDSTGFEDQRTHSDYLLFLAGYRETHPEPQPHADPGEVERLRYKAELYDEVWELATGLGYMNVTTAISKLRSQLAECEAMAAMVAEREWAEHVGTGDGSSKVEAAFTQLHNDLHEASEKLAERDALLRGRFGEVRKLAERASGRPKDSPEYRSLLEAINPTMLLDLTALSDSAEPSAPVEIDERAEFEAFFTEKAKTLPLLRGATTLRYPGGQYVGDWALFGFTVWQARADLHCKP